jgi:ATP-dependent RNA helicase DeaD
MAKVIAKDLQGGFFWNEQTSRDVESVPGRVRVSVLRFEDSLSQRATALDGFRETPVGGGGAILFTSDLASRGLDVPDVSHVIHFDLADAADTYVHRSGRTGRLGKPGQVLSIVTPAQEFVLQRFANALQVEMSCVGRQSGGGGDARGAGSGKKKKDKVS